MRPATASGMLLPDLSRLAVSVGAPKRAAPALADKPHYKILGIEDPSNASDVDIRYKFLRLAKVLHPDKNPGDPKANEKFIQLKEAYDVLIDPNKRREYDAEEDGGEGLSGSWWDAYEAVRGVPLTTDDIDLFLDAYRGSHEEKADVIKYFTENKGDVTRMLGAIMGSRDEDADRYLDIIDLAIQSGGIERKYNDFDRAVFSERVLDVLQGQPLADIEQLKQLAVAEGEKRRGKRAKAIKDASGAGSSHDGGAPSYAQAARRGARRGRGRGAR